MTRRVITAGLQGTGDAPVDGYLDRVVKYIPADVVAAWLAASAAINSAKDVPTTTLLWIAFFVGAALTPVWILDRTRLPGAPAAKTQALLATVSFGAWIFAIGGPFARYSFYRPVYGSLVLIAISLALGLVARAD